jgi:serine/threonine protein kinase
MAAESCFMRNSSGLISVDAKDVVPRPVCDCGLGLPHDYQNQSLGKLITELTVAVRSTNATERLSKLSHILTNLIGIMRTSDLSRYATESFVALLPSLLQVKSIVRDSRSNQNFLQLFIAWLTCSSLLMTVLMQKDPDNSKAHIGFIQDRVFELTSQDQSSAIRSIIVRALIDDGNSCDLVAAVLVQLQSLAEVSNNKPQISYIETIISVILVIPGFIQNECIRSTSLLIKFATNHSPLVDKTLFDKFITAKFFAHQNHNEMTSLIIDTLIDFSPLTHSIGLSIVQFIHRLFLTRKKDVLDSPPEQQSPDLIGIPTLAIGPDQLPISILSLHPLKIKYLELLFSCIFSNIRKNIISDYSEEFPIICKKIPIFFHFFLFISNEKEPIELSNSVLMKLLFNRKNQRVFSDGLELVGSGQFGSVYCDKKRNRAIKLIKVPTSVNDRCTIIDAYNEILAMSVCKTDSFCLELIDWGSIVDDSGHVMNFYIESELFVASLTKFRSVLISSDDHQQSPPLSTVLLLIVFSEILAGVESLHKDAKLIHYDLKMDNILVEFGGQVSLEIARNRRLIPRIAIADFGEARVVEPGITCVRNRGTECIKSPEILSLANRMKKDGIMFDRRRAIDTSYASDIWSLGCLFYELITGQYLFRNVDGNWIDFYYRVTGEGGTMESDILPTYAQDELGDPRFVEFVRFLLVRDADRRPNIDGVIKRFQRLYSSYIVDPSLFPAGTRIELPDSIPGALRVNIR